MRLSEREKRLLYLAMLILILAVGITRFLLPAYGQYVSGKEAYAAAESEREFWKEEQKQVKILENNREELRRSYEKWRRTYKKPTANDVMEQQVLECLELNHLVPVNTSVKSNGAVSLKSEEEKIAGAEKSAEAVVTAVSIEAEGSMKNFLGYVKEMEQIPCMRIEAFRIDRCSGDGKLKFIIEVNCYMLEDPNEEG